MFKKLRIKFIIIGTIAVAVSVMALICAINVVNFVRVDKETTDIVRMLADNKGHFPGDMDAKKPGENGENGENGGEALAAGEPAPGEMFASPEEDKPVQGANEGVPENVAPIPDNMFRTREFQYETRFFSAEITAGSEYKLNLSNIATISEEEAAKLISIVASGKKTTGYTNEYKYYIRNINDDKKIVVMMDCSSRFDNLRSTAGISLGVGAVGIIIMFIFLSLATKKILQPVEESETKQKQFITDASHELKTPLTVISTNMDVLAMDTGKNEWIEGTKEQVVKMRDLVNQMVTLSRLEESEELVKGSAFRADEVTKEAAEPFLTVAEYKGKEMVVVTTDNITITTDESLYKQLISILCDNAIKYSDEEGSIKVSLEKKGRKAILQVINTSDLAATKEDVKHLFDRFYRIDSARTKSDEERNGNGIGLSIANAIALRMGGRISASADKLGNKQIREIFPNYKVAEDRYIYVFTVTLPLKDG
ncbi:MAG: HAMP domain-containing histidine kinase [Lachnospiraceae bacterium]|nr:HAMP domain-containing histidine kinase [Lachnospiraceae bacterium]